MLQDIVHCQHVHTKTAVWFHSLKLTDRFEIDIEIDWDGKSVAWEP